jgi:hypothetical protein
MDPESRRMLMELNDWERIDALSKASDEQDYAESLDREALREWDTEHGQEQGR